MKLTTIKSLAAAALCAVGLSSFAAEPEAVQLWEGGPYWATVNVGTSEEGQPVEYGGLYKFNDDEAKNAAEGLGEGWRLPTKEEFQALLSNCGNGTWTEQNGVNGRLFTSKSDSLKSIFFPAAGYTNNYGFQNGGISGFYWAATDGEDGKAYNFNFGSDGVWVSEKDISWGMSVRAVRDTPPPVPPSVTVDKVESADPWDSAKGTIKVDYTLGGVDAKLDYKVAFDVTAGGQTASVTNAAAKLTNGKATKEIDTATLFGKEVVDTKAKVKVSLIAIKPKTLGGVQLWADGPFFAECNVGANTPEGYGIHTNFNDAAQAVTDALGEGWRVPSSDEWLALISNCGQGTWTEQNGVNGRRFTGTGNCESNSIFLPAAGYDDGSGLGYVGERGSYWSSTEAADANKAGRLVCDSMTSKTSDVTRSNGNSVRAVRDAK